MDLDLAAATAAWPVGSSAVAVVATDAAVGPSVGITLTGDGTVYPWASVTKIIAALTVLDAAADGVVDLCDAVGPPGVTLAHLLAHAGGLGATAGGQVSAPGSRRIYSNYGYELAADHVASAAGRPFAQECHERVLAPLAMTATVLSGSPAHGMAGPIEDLARLGGELLVPRVLQPEIVTQASTVAFPGLSGVLPGYGRQEANDWGLGCEIRDHKDPHWTAPENSPATFGHFGQSGSFLWVDRAAGVACASLADTPFGPWAVAAWPVLSSAVLSSWRGRAR